MTKDPHIMHIPMNDLKREYALLQNEIDDGLSDVLRSGMYIGGDMVEGFEKSWADYLRAPYVISCANGTDALLIALMALSLEPGDEVIMPSYGYIAAAESAVLLGLKPVLVDVGVDYNIDVSLIEDAITDRTKVILPIHLFGLCADMQTIMAIAKKHQLYVIEDAAQASGGVVTIDGKTRKAGTVGTIGCFSHFPTKNLGCFGDGGSICCGDDDLVAKMKRIKRHGQTTKYIHEELGINSRLDAIQAAILKVKLVYLDQHNDRRRKVAKIYTDTINNEKLKVPDFIEDHTYHQYAIRVSVKERSAVKDLLQQNGIATTTYYPKAISDQEAISDKAIVHSDTRSKELALSNLCLPMSPTMTDEEITYICDVINDKL